MNVILFIIILAFLVLVHELGHYLFAKRAGVKVDEFGIGYPPRARKLFKRGDTTFTLNWLPFGGFVKIFGENPADVDPNGPDAGRSLISKSKWTQAGILFAGILFNFIIGWIFLSLSFFIGTPTSATYSTEKENITDISLRVIAVTPESPSSDAGISSGDTIVSVTAGDDSFDIKSPELLREFVGKHQSEAITIVYKNNDKEKTATITPEKLPGEDQARIGLGVDLIGLQKLPAGKALYQGFISAGNASIEIVKVLGGLIRDLFVGKPDLSNITGPVGIVGAVGDATEFGFSYLLSFIALISLNLAVINIIPFPALDGGRLFFLLIESVIRRPIAPKVAGIVNFVGFSLLIIFMLVVTYRDIQNLF